MKPPIDIYRVALTQLGIGADLPVLDQDRESARLFGVSERTARRYRRGEINVPKPVWRLINALLEQNFLLKSNVGSQTGSDPIESIRDTGSDLEDGT